MFLHDIRLCEQRIDRSLGIHFCHNRKYPLGAAEGIEEIVDENDIFYRTGDHRVRRRAID
jgi:hypothetical protein